MASSKATTVEGYLDELPPDRREVMEAVRALVNANLPAGYREAMAFGMIGWGVPLSVYPDTYNGQPIGICALAAQKGSYSLYLMAAYGDSEQERALKEGYAAAGKKLDMGKSCLRFKKLDDLVPDAVAAVLRSTPPERLMAQHDEVHGAKRRPKKG